MVFYHPSVPRPDIFPRDLATRDKPRVINNDDVTPDMQRSIGFVVSRRVDVLNCLLLIGKRDNEWIVD